MGTKYSLLNPIGFRHCALLSKHYSVRYVQLFLVIVKLRKPHPYDKVFNLIYIVLRTHPFMLAYSLSAYFGTSLIQTRRDNVVLDRRANTLCRFHRSHDILFYSPSADSYGTDEVAIGIEDRLSTYPRKSVPAVRNPETLIVRSFCQTSLPPNTTVPPLVSWIA